MMTDGSRRNRSERIKLVPVEDQAQHAQRVKAMKNHPARAKKAELRVVWWPAGDNPREENRESR
jgi:hypothetical protein